MARSLSIRPAKPRLTIWIALRAVLRLILPVVALLGIYLWAYLGLNTSITAFDVFPSEKWFLNPGYWLTAGHFIIPLAFLVSNLTNRRYGDGYALAQLVVTWVLIGALLYLFMRLMGGAMPFSPLPNRRASLAFAFALFLGQAIAIYIFDRTRGRVWWGAPLFSALWGQSIFVVTYYTLSHIGTNEPWTNFMLMDLTIKVCAAFLMLVPYHLLRKAIRPLPGYGGA